MSIVSLKDWRDYPTGKEKYQLYLASREWAVLREAVKQRSNGTCERCRSAPGQSVHHQTYERVYEERLEDLVHTCEPCHEFLSGKRDSDPAVAKPAMLEGRVIKTVYLAGKMASSPLNPFRQPARSWRDEIVLGGWSIAANGCGESSPNWDTKPNCLPLPDGRTLDLSGPFWRRCATVANDEAVGAIGSHLYSRLTRTREGLMDFEEDHCDLAYMITESIARSDLVFAWIDRPDCFGTLVELGFARASDKAIAVAWPDHLDMAEMWLAAEMGWAAGSFLSAKHAWYQLWANQDHSGSLRD